jgi:aarF domain-containing kinase
MDKALSPYVMGGGAKKYEAELKKLYGMEDGSIKSQVGGFQAMTQDALTVLDQIPFSIPPYFAILGRAIVTLEGVALSGNENYGIILESYPFIARMLLREGRPEIQKALQEVLYSKDGESSGLKFTRLLALLNNAAGSVATQDGAAFVDLDAIPEDGISLKDGMKFVLSDNAGSLRALLESEMDNVVDVLSRQIMRRAATEAVVALTPPRPPSLPFLGDIFPLPPALDEVPLPILLPSLGEAGLNRPSISIVTLKELIDAAAPKLDQDEDVFAIGLAEGARKFFGDEIGDLIKGERVLSVATVDLVLKALRSGVLGGTPADSQQATESVIQFVQNAVSVLRRGSGSSSTSDDTEFAEALESLSPEERDRFDEIVNELTQSAIKRTVDRLSKIERVL